MAGKAKNGRTWRQYLTETELGLCISGGTLVLVIGLICGAAIPPDATYAEPYRHLSSFIGWIYFAAWSISFYPQVLTNWKRKSVEGLSFEYVYLNLVGFTCYSVYNCALMWNPSVRVEYQKQYNGSLPAVQTNDVFFGLHAVVLTIIVIIQTFKYERGEQRLAKWCIAYLVIMITAIVTYAVIIAAGANGSLWTMLNFVTFLSYCKLAITLTKYTPQAYLNWKRKSTTGWTIYNVLLDFVGGLLSVVQLLMDCYVTSDWSGIQGDPVKFGLGFTSMVFDIVFMAQHYVLYPEPSNGSGYARVNGGVTSPAGSDAAFFGSANSNNAGGLDPEADDPLLVKVAFIETR